MNLSFPLTLLLILVDLRIVGFAIIDCTFSCFVNLPEVLIP